MSSDKIGKDHMINAIATVLHFSPHEVSDWLDRVISCAISLPIAGSIDKAESIWMVGNYII